MCLFWITCFPRVAVSLLCRSQGRTISSPFSNYIGIIWNTFDTACNRHSNETLTLGKHVTKYKNMRKWKVEFLRKFENRGIKFSRVNSILIIKSINFLLWFCMVLGSVVIKRRFSVHSPFMEKSMTQSHSQSQPVAEVLAYLHVQI